MKKLTPLFILLLLFSSGNLVFGEEGPDFTVTEINCVNDKIEFMVRNRGGYMPSHWSLFAELYIDGHYRAYLDLKGRSNNYPPLPTPYGWRKIQTEYIVSKTLDVKIIIKTGMHRPGDPTESTHNNTLEKTLHPCRSTNLLQKPILGTTYKPVPQGRIDMAKPDLIVKDITMETGCIIHVRVANIGTASVPSSVWDPPHFPDDASVNIKLHGLIKGGAPIWKFDTLRKLRPVGGEAVYVSDFKVSGSMSITAVIDYTNKVPEKKDYNNTRSEKFVCRN